MEERGSAENWSDIPFVMSFLNENIDKKKGKTESWQADSMFISTLKELLDLWDFEKNTI